MGRGGAMVGVMGRWGQYGAMEAVWGDGGRYDERNNAKNGEMRRFVRDVIVILEI